MVEANLSVNRAIIPAAGRGTRMRPISYVLPKELLPIGTVPMIQFAVEEAAAAGIGHVILVINREKQQIREYFEHIQAKGDLAQLTLHFRYQEEARGLADAIEHCRDLTEEAPFALVLPDNVLFSPHYRLGSLIDLYGRFRQDIVGVIELTHEDSGLYGNAGRIDHERLEERVIRITRLYDKKPGTIRIEPGEKIPRTCGRYVFHRDFFDYVDRVRPAVSGEFDEVAVVQQIIDERQAIGYLIPPPLFDTGNRRGYLAAGAYLHRSEQ